MRTWIKASVGYLFPMAQKSVTRKENNVKEKTNIYFDFLKKVVIM